MLLTTYTTRDGNIVTHAENKLACVLAGVNLLAIEGFMASQGGLIALDIMKVSEQDVSSNSVNDARLSQENGTLVKVALDDIKKSITAYVSPVIANSLGEGVLEILYCNLEYLKAAISSQGYSFELVYGAKVEREIAY